jgi:hypothetical protein
MIGQWVLWNGCTWVATCGLEGLTTLHRLIKSMYYVFTFNVVNLTDTSSTTMSMLLHSSCFRKWGEEGGLSANHTHATVVLPSMSATVYGREGTISGFTPIQRVFPHASVTHFCFLLLKVVYDDKYITSCSN